jgi:hypothetical protein
MVREPGARSRSMSASSKGACSGSSAPTATLMKGLTLVHISAELEHLLWDRGYA